MISSLTISIITILNWLKDNSLLTIEDIILLQTVYTCLMIIIIVIANYKKYH